MKQALTDGLPELVLFFPYQNRLAAMTGKPHRKKKNHNVGADRVGSQAEVGSAKTGFYGGITLSCCPCGIALSPLI